MFIKLKNHDRRGHFLVDITVVKVIKQLCYSDENYVELSLCHKNQMIETVYTDSTLEHIEKVLAYQGLMN